MEAVAVSHQLILFVLLKCRPDGALFAFIFSVQPKCRRSAAFAEYNNVTALFIWRLMSVL